MSKFILPILAIVLGLTACGPNYIYQSDKTVADSQWMYRDSVVFDFNIKDSSHLYNLYLNFDAQKDYATENVYVRLNTIFPSGQRLSTVRSFNIFDAQGKILGKTSGNSAKQHIMLQENTFFNELGQYRIVVEQFMRKDSLIGINAIGLDIEQLDLQKGK
jgi:gliding motility-associated lipoprotein GldH